MSDAEMPGRDSGTVLTKTGAPKNPKGSAIANSSRSTTTQAPLPTHTSSTSTTTDVSCNDASPPPYTLAPSLSERIVAQKIQLTEGRKLIGTAMELERQRAMTWDVLDREYPEPDGDVDVAEALARKPGKGTFAYRLERERLGFEVYPEKPRQMTREQESKMDFERAKIRWRVLADDVKKLESSRQRAQISTVAGHFDIMEKGVIDQRFIEQDEHDSGEEEYGIEFIDECLVVERDDSGYEEDGEDEGVH